MMKQIQALLVLLLLAVAMQTRAQRIDFFHVDRSATPHELFVRLEFPDSSYYVERTFDRVALIYPPVNIITFFYRSCQSVKARPVRDTMIPIYTPEPYRVLLWLVKDSNTVMPGCAMAGQIENVDSASYNSQQTGIASPVTGGKGLLLFPNPAAGVLHVIGAPGLELLVSDGLGRQQLRQKLQRPQEQIDISALVPGLYYIHCYRDGRLLQSQCFTRLP